MTAGPDQAPAGEAGEAVDPATGRIAPAVLDALGDQLDQRRAERAAEGERAKATAHTCALCGAGESWRRPPTPLDPVGEAAWHRDARGSICWPCNLDMRSFQRPDGAIMPDAEHRARVIAELIGEAEARQQYPPLLIEKAPTLLRWWHETPGAEPGQGAERFAYVDVAALLAHPLLHAPPPPPPTLHSRGRKVRCPGCGCRGECWTVDQVGVPTAVTNTGELSRVALAHFRVTWTCHACRHVDVERRAEQVPGVPVRMQVG